jgi:iron only hydrogenase large subunit-like protein
VIYVVPEEYFEIFRTLIKAYNEGNLEEKYNELILKSDSELKKKYIFSAMGIDYRKNASFQDIKKAMEMKKMKGKIVVKVGDCGLRCIDKEGLTDCQRGCPFDAINTDIIKKTTTINDKCTECGVCINECKHGKLIDKIEYLPLTQHFTSGEDVYAITAPAYIGQFGENVTPAKLRSALKQAGFKDMIEVALFADILTVKEALDFGKYVHDKKDFMITSCCCPMWVAMIRRLYTDLVKHVQPSVSPMVACGRTVKKLDKNAKVAFIGPCVAKKAEAKEKDISDAVDFVLTFSELKEIFNAMGIEPEMMSPDEGEHASRGGRIYAFTGGVSEAVGDTVNRLSAHRDIKVNSIQGNGVKDCRELLQKLSSGDIEANFIEGMGCMGGCVGGPKAVIKMEDGRIKAQQYGNSTDMLTPLDNPCMYSALKSIEMNEIYDLIDNNKSKIFEREF